ncbi:MAG: redox-regulated ATPase YchF [Chloroflexota bacterium]
MGRVDVPDARLDTLARLVRPRHDNVVPTWMEFVDIAGLVRGASRGEGLGNQFLGKIREVDAIGMVVRCFQDPNVIHVEGGVDPLRDIETINTELGLADLATVERQAANAARAAKSGDKRLLADAAFLERLRDHLNAGGLARTFQVDGEEHEELLRGMFLLTLKPVLYIANVDEGDLATLAHTPPPLLAQVQTYAATEGASVVPVSAKLEAELGELDEADARAYMDELGIAEGSLGRMIRAGYALLGLITFFTAGEPEVRAWTITRGTKAPQAAGKIHTDIERGFIRAEVTSFDDFVACGSAPAARERGLTRLEGKEYVMQDGDVVYFRFAL